MIISVEEHYEGRTASQDIKDFQRKYTRNFLVRTDDNENEFSVINAGALPVVGVAFHPQDTTCVANRKRANEKAITQEGHLWLVTVEYDSIQPNTLEEDPLLRDYEVSGGYEKQNVPVVEDLADPPLKVLNSAGDPFDSPVEVQKSTSRVSITKIYEYADFDFTILEDVKDTTNDGSWWFLDAYQAKMDGISWTLKTENNIRYIHVTYTVAIDLENGYHPVQILDRGFRGWQTSLSPMVFLDDHGVPLQKPRLLDGTGFALEDADPAVFIDFTLVKAASWINVPAPI